MCFLFILILNSFLRYGILNFFQEFELSKFELSCIPAKVAQLVRGNFSFKTSQSKVLFLKGLTTLRVSYKETCDQITSSFLFLQQ